MATLPSTSGATRPDIAYSVSYLGQFNSSYELQHWKAAKRVLRYLKHSEDFGIKFYPLGTWNRVIGYVDADWGGCKIDRRSYTGFCFEMSGGCISWESRKQRTVALSSVESEYMGLTEATKEALYLRNFLKEIGMKPDSPIALMNDSQGAQFLANNAASSSRSKHIDLRYHFIRDVIKEGKIEVGYVPTERMPADILTKALNKEKHSKCMDMMKVVNINQSSYNSRGCVRNTHYI